MIGEVTLESFVLRRTNFPSSWRPAAGQGFGPTLRAELVEFAYHSSVAVLLDNLVDDSNCASDPETVVERIGELIELGWVDVTLQRSVGATAVATVAPATAVDSTEGAPAARNPPPAAPTDASSEPQYAPETAQTAAQVATLLSAAYAGVPFCEVCEQTAKAEAQREQAKAATEAAQVATMTTAAASGAAFCEVCQ